MGRQEAFGESLIAKKARRNSEIMIDGGKSRMDTKSGVADINDYAHMSGKERKKVRASMHIKIIFILTIPVASLIFGTYTDSPTITVIAIFLLLFMPLLALRDSLTLWEFKGIDIAESVAERATMADFKAPFSFRDIQKRIFSAKLAWRYGPTAAAVVFVLLATVVYALILAADFLLAPYTSGVHIFHDPIVFGIILIVLYMATKKSYESMVKTLRKNFDGREEGDPFERLKENFKRAEIKEEMHSLKISGYNTDPFRRK